MPWSPYKDSIINFVRRNVGCSKYDVAKHITRDPRRGVSKQYGPVNTAIKHNWIHVFDYGQGQRHCLTVPVEGQWSAVNQAIDHVAAKDTMPHYFLQLRPAGLVSDEAPGDAVVIFRNYEWIRKYLTHGDSAS